MARKKRKCEYALQDRWKDAGFFLSGVKGVINGKTFNGHHADIIARRGLEWKYLAKAGGETSGTEADESQPS